MKDLQNNPAAGATGVLPSTPNHASDGKFQKGNKANRGGNPTSRAKKVRLRMKRALCEVLARNDYEALRSIAESLTAKAKEGNLQAIREMKGLLNASDADVHDDVQAIKRQLQTLRGSK
jgi:hypothetical protein